MRAWVALALAVGPLSGCRSTGPIHERFHAEARSIDAEYEQNMVRLSANAEGAAGMQKRAHATRRDSLITEFRVSLSEIEAQYKEVARLIKERVSQAADTARRRAADERTSGDMGRRAIREVEASLEVFLRETLPAWRAERLSELDAAYNAQLEELEKAAELKATELDKDLGARLAAIERDRREGAVAVRKLHDAKIAYAQSVRDAEVAQVEAQNRAAAAAIIRGIGQGLQEASANYNATVNRNRPVYNAWSAPAPQVASPNVGQCSNDYQCPFGQQCLKRVGSFQGYCAQPVDSFGLRQMVLPSPDSVYFRPFGSEQCRFDVDCPVGFFCEQSAKACLKR